MVFQKNFFGYHRSQIKGEAKKNDSKEEKQQQHNTEQQKGAGEVPGQAEEDSGITVSVDSAGYAAFYCI